MGIVLTVVAVVIVAAVAVILLRKKPAAPEDSGQPVSLKAETPTDGTNAPSRAPKNAVVEESTTAAPAPPLSRVDDASTPVENERPVQASDHPAEPASEGVRLDDGAEQTAAINLKAARRERKLQKLRQGLSRTRGGFIARIGELFKERKEIDAAFLSRLEEMLITADVGAGTTEWLLSMMKEALDKDELKSSDAVWDLLKSEVKTALSVDCLPWNAKQDKPFTIMVVGVNGAGKTTTIGKLASQMTEQGLKVVLAAGDTFRAAAVNQLEIWGRRTGSEVIKPSKEGADPSSVVFDAVKRAKEIGADVVIADTAGRLHTQAPLMEELKKISRVMTKAHDAAPHEILLVLDATTGQNALQQAREFGEALQLTGIALTKLDGTAKGGVIIGICHEQHLPIRFIGIGEAKDDLREFEVTDFVEALFLRDENADA